MEIFSSLKCLYILLFIADFVSFELREYYIALLPVRRTQIQQMLTILRPLIEIYTMFSNLFFFVSNILLIFVKSYLNCLWINITL